MANKFYGWQGKKGKVIHLADSSNSGAACGAGRQGWAYEFGERNAEAFIIDYKAKHATCTKCRKIDTENV